MRKALIVTGILVACVVFAAAALLLLADVNQLRPQIEAQLQKRLDRPVSLGAIGLKLLPLSVRVDSVTIGEDASLRSTRPFVAAKEISIRAELMPLLRKQIEIRSIVLRDPAIELIKSKQGGWNYASIGSGSSGGSGQQQKLAIERIEIVNGSVAITDLHAGDPRAVYDHIDLTLEMPGGVLSGSGSLKVSNKSLDEIGLGSVDVTYHLALDQDRRQLDVAPLTVKAAGGQIDAKVSIKQLGTPSSAMTMSGTLANLSLRLPALTAPLALKTASFAFDGNAIKLSNLHTSLGTSNIRGAGSVRNFKSPEIQFQADVDKLDAAEMQKLVAAPKGASPQKPGGLRNVTGGGTLRIGALRYNDMALNNIRATCTLDRGVIRLDPIESELAGGGQVGSIAIDTRGEHPAIAVTTKLDKVDANQLLSSTTSLKQILYGLLAGQADTRFVARPGEDIARSLNGEVRLDLTEGKLLGGNLVNEMALLGKFLNVVKSPDAFTTIVRLTGALKITDGVANTDDLRLDFGGGTMGAAGAINLVDQSLNLRLTTVLNKELSARAGSTALGVLANKQGELVLPATVTGTLAKPRFAPDAKRLAEMKLKSILPTTDPATGQPDISGVRGVFDALRGKKQPPPEQGAEAGAKQASPTESLLDLFRRKKETKPPPQ